MILVDSSVWIDYFRGIETRQTAALDYGLGRMEILIGDLILTEVLQGFSDEKDFLAVRRLFESFRLIEIGGVMVAIQAARNHRLLRRKGITIRRTIDTLIATRCIEDSIGLLHSDRDFDPFVEHLGLRTVA